MNFKFKAQFNCIIYFIGIATAMKQAQSADFKKYQQQVKTNAKCLAKELADRGYKIVTGS